MGRGATVQQHAWRSIDAEAQNTSKAAGAKITELYIKDWCHNNLLFFASDLETLFTVPQLCTGNGWFNMAETVATWSIKPASTSILMKRDGCNHHLFTIQQLLFHSQNKFNQEIWLFRDAFRLYLIHQWFVTVLKRHVVLPIVASDQKTLLCVVVEGIGPDFYLFKQTAIVWERLRLAHVAF